MTDMSTDASNRQSVLTLNSGSSSLKFAMFEGGSARHRSLSGKFDRIGISGGELSVIDVKSGIKSRRDVSVRDHASCLPILGELLRDRGLANFEAVGHRVVHGGPNHMAPVRVTPALLGELRRLEPFAPNHLPAAIALMEGLSRERPKVPQVACFDTAFHQGLPLEAKLLGVPRRYAAQGVRRYGFHGLAFQSVLGDLRSQTRGALPSRLLLAHLGNGASMAAVRDGHCVDTTMGFTPLGGLVMSTRSGDIDPGLVAFLASLEGLGPAQIERLFSAESGLLGLSETSSDVRDLLAREETDPRAAEALAVFCHQARKFIGALSAVLGGLDGLVFSGGIGENSAVIRRRLCAGFEFLGLALDAGRNLAGSPIISSDQSKVTVRIIVADEERLLATEALALLSAKTSAQAAPTFSPAGSP
jgi:acetate kinase